MEKGMEEQATSETEETAAEAVKTAEGETERPEEEAAGDAGACGAKEGASDEDITDEEEGSGDEDENGAEGMDPKSWAEKRAAKKQAKLDKKADAYKSQIEQLEDKVKRQLAEFENFRNRTEKEKSQMYAIGAKDVIEKILPVVDNFERGLAAVPQEEKGNPVIEGMDKIYKQLMTTLTDLGVKPIEAAGQEFDPNFHNAVMHVEDEELGENMVAEEFQKGYTYRDTVIRHSMVKVAN